MRDSTFWRRTDDIKQVRHIVIPRCDHKGCTFSLDIIDSNRGRGFWKCNVSVLEDVHFRDDLFALFETFRLESENNTPNWEVWDSFKSKVKNLIISHSVRLSVNRKIKQSQLLNTLNFLHEIEVQKPGCATSQIAQAEAELQDLANYRREGEIVRSRVHQLENAETSASFFERTAKRNGEKKLIESLEINGQPSSNINEIILHCRSFYSQLLHSQSIDKTQWSILSNNLSTLSREMRKFVKDRTLILNVGELFVK
jgi:hypothetical protein